jgi:hypothetical protein
MNRDSVYRLRRRQKAQEGAQNAKRTIVSVVEEMLEGYNPD